MIADAATIFLWEQATHASRTHHLEHSTIQTEVRLVYKHKQVTFIYVISKRMYLFGLSELNSASIVSGRWSWQRTLLKVKKNKALIFIAKQVLTLVQYNYELALTNQLRIASEAWWDGHIQLQEGETELPDQEKNKKVDQGWTT